MTTTSPERQRDSIHSNRSSMIALQDLSESDVSQDLTTAEHQVGKHFQDREKDAAYRKLYGIITIMTFLLFVLNIVQVCLLQVIDSLYWILICPAIIFVAFTSWALVFIYFNRETFYNTSSKAAKDGENAWEHLKALFSLKERSERSKHYDEAGPHWPIRFSRAGVLLTSFLNIILCQFIYLPIFALPDFKEITWDLKSNSTDNIMTPSFALIQDVNISRRATLEENITAINEVCAEKRELVGPTQFCFGSAQDMPPTERDDHTNRYAIFDGTQYPSVKYGENMDLWYRYTYNGTASPDPLLSLAVFRQDRIPEFEQAYKCGIISKTLLPAKSRVQVNLQQNDIHDDLNATKLEPECRKNRLRPYSSYDIDVINLGGPSDLGPNQCDFNNSKIPSTGPCRGDLTFAFTSRLTRVYTSEHGKDWITILTEEGGVVGFVTFLTWFFGIFSI